MRLHANIPNTVGLWQFQGNLIDSSGVLVDGSGAPSPGGSRQDLATLDGNTFHTSGGVEQYAALDLCIQGFKFNGATKLWAPPSAPLRVTGDMTIEYLLMQVGTFSQTYCVSADPAGRSGGASPDRIGSLFSFFWGSPNNPYYRNRNTGSGTGGSFWGQFNANSVTWGVGTLHHYAFRRGGTTMDGFFDGVKLPLPNPVAWDGQDAPPNTSLGNERFYVGGCEGASTNLGNTSVMASLRVLSTARSDALIAADAAYLLQATCEPYVPPFSARGGFGAENVG